MLLELPTPYSPFSRTHSAGRIDGMLPVVARLIEEDQRESLPSHGKDAAASGLQKSGAFHQCEGAVDPGALGREAPGQADGVVAPKQGSIEQPLDFPRDIAPMLAIPGIGDSPVFQDDAAKYRGNLCQLRSVSWSSSSGIIIIDDHPCIKSVRLLQEDIKSADNTGGHVIGPM